jgi:hypothetical protein
MKGRREDYRTEKQYVKMEVVLILDEGGSFKRNHLPPMKRLNKFIELSP